LKVQSSGQLTVRRRSHTFEYEWNAVDSKKWGSENHKRNIWNAANAMYYRHSYETPLHHCDGEETELLLDEQTTKAKTGIEYFL